MEWRIILPVLCLIGILHLPGYVVSQGETTTATTVTSASTATTVTSATTATTVTSASTANTVTSASTATGASSALTAAGTSSTTIGPLPAFLGVVNLAFKTNDTFQPAFSNLSDPITIVFVDKLKSQLETLYRKRYPNFYKLIVNSLSAGSVVANTSIEFDTTRSSAPNGTDVKNTLIEAITNGNITLSIDNTSISSVQVSSNVTTPTTATTVPSASTAAGTSSTTIGPLPAFLGVVNLAFKTNDTFQPAYSNLSDPITIVFVDKLKSQLQPVYWKRYANFYKLIVNSLSAGSVVANTSLQFDTTRSSAPNGTDVKNTLIEAINNGNISLSIDNTSISAVQVSSNGSSTTASSNTSTSATQTTTAATPAVDLANYNITFKMSAPFHSDLSNPNSNAFILLATGVNTQLTWFFSNFRGFSATGVRRFRNGSIIVDAWLAFFKNINAPNGTELAKEFASAVRNQTVLFPIDPVSINITDFTGFTANKSPVLASMLTALWMTLASLLFSAVMH